MVDDGRSLNSGRWAGASVWAAVHIQGGVTCRRKQRKAALADGRCASCYDVPRPVSATPKAFVCAFGPHAASPRTPRRFQVFLLCNNESEESLRVGRVVDVSWGMGRTDQGVLPFLLRSTVHRGHSVFAHRRPRGGREWGHGNEGAQGARILLLRAAYALQSFCHAPLEFFLVKSLHHFAQVKITFVTRDALKVSIEGSGTEGVVRPEDVSSAMERSAGSGAGLRLGGPEWQDAMRGRVGTTARARILGLEEQPDATGEGRRFVVLLSTKWVTGEEGEESVGRGRSA